MLHVYGGAVGENRDKLTPNQQVIDGPKMNSRQIAAQLTALLYHDSIDLGIAVDSAKGLIAPVIRDAQTKSIDDLAAAMADLPTRVRLAK